MSVSARSHPEYPFSNENLEAGVLEIEKFISEPQMNGAERGEVLEFVRLTRQFGFLERLIQGDVFFDLPVHMEIFAEEKMPPEAQAEAMAREEREILDLGTGPGATLAETLDDRGIKVFRRCHGADPSDELSGGFFYAGSSGPALLACACSGNPDVAFILAHEYGHLVMDVNPYASRFCRWQRDDLSNRNVSSMEEARADRFARALLVPEDLLTGDWRDLDIERTAEILDVAPAVVWRRLGDIGAQRGASPPRPIPLISGREIDETRPTDLPERYVNLALAAYSSRIVEKTDLARFLRVPPERVAQFLEWSRIPRDLRRADFAAADDDE